MGEDVLMRDLPPLLVTVDWAARMATVAVHGELDNATCSQLLERLTWVLEGRPRHLVLDLVGVTEGFGEQAVTVIAAAQKQLPPTCVLEVRSASPDMRSALRSAGCAGIQLSTGP